MSVTKQRIRHLFPHHGAIQPDESIPRGWISAQGHFFPTKEHWTSITSQFRSLNTRSLEKQAVPEDAEEAEKTAQLAYSLGWVSVGHAGKLNAVGHSRTFDTRNHPAIATLRRLLTNLPHLSIPIELQTGDFSPSRGVHENFDLREYDLDFFIRRGRLREAHQ